MIADVDYQKHEFFNQHNSWYHYKLFPKTQLIYCLSINNAFPTLINKNSETLLQKGQGALIKNNNMLVCTTQSTNHARFKGILNTKVLLKRSEDYAVAQITLGNIEFDFSDALREADDEEIVYRNVKLIVYPGSYSISILGDWVD